MRNIKEACEKEEIVSVKVMGCKEIESSKGTPGLNIFMKCKDSLREDLDGWLSITVWASKGSEFFTQKFLDSLENEIEIGFECGVWIYDIDILKYNTGKCKVHLNKGGYPESMRWIEDERLSKPKEDDKIDDDDIPF
tara:strand:+ start:1192 stop:1602 length:411 start_codon:yes stop_codon:yes gene_type:complete